MTDARGQYETREGAFGTEHLYALLLRECGETWVRRVYGTDLDGALIRWALSEPDDVPRVVGWCRMRRGVAPRFTAMHEDLTVRDVIGEG